MTTMTKHTPATPLPWLADDLPVHASLNKPRLRQNRAYAAHAANSYPKLVEALRHLEHVASTRDRQAIEDALITARDLLRELGEVA